ncbi:MAG: hypothetical protein QOG77_4051 [Solirubrobacteraceae bacterium]|nr:hypothetical protein [Solirubrobacteraceae bacterium]
MHGRLACAAFCALLLLIPAASASADSDNFLEAKYLPFGTTDATVSNVGSMIQTPESLTVNGPGNRNACLVGGDSTMYSRATATRWWILTGTGRPISVTTANSTFDTHLGIFASGIDGDAMCQDGDPNETLTFDSVAGQPYRIQVGGCGENTINGCGNPTGQIHVRATSPPAANDGIASAIVLPSGQILAGDNYAATEEPGEQAACGPQAYGRTVWYRWSSATVGSVLFTVSDPNAAIAVYSAAGAPLGCEATPGGDARLALNVGRGDYLVQVGGVGAHNGLVTDSAQGRFSLQAMFTESPDRDADGVTNAGDCAPDDPRRRPGAKDVPRNKVDEDCSGRDANYPTISSRAALGVSLFLGYSKVTSISARNVPAGAKIQLRCSGRSCPFKQTKARTIKKKRSSVSLMTSALRAVRIRPPTTIEVRVTRTGRIGKVMRFRFDKLRKNPTLSTRCLVPGSKSPRKC